MKKIIAILLFCSAVLPAEQVVIPIEKYKLGNGMRVILSRDTAVPVVSIYLIYDVGARSEEPGRTGFAHLFEHMMFQGSANAPKGVHFQTVNANGGQKNSSTHFNFTGYYRVMPSNKLAVGVWFQSACPPGPAA